MRFKVIDARCTAVSKRALLSAVASSLIVAQAGAQQYLTPPGCDLKLQNAQLFTSLNNQIGTTGTAVGSSLNSAEASTAQVMEIVAQRRAQEAESCPANFSRVGGFCQPVRRIALAEPASSSPATPVDTGATLTSTGKTNSVRRSSVAPDRRQSVAKPDDSRLKPEQEATRNAVWSEAFADYERRRGLGNASESASRKQATAGVLFGADHAVWNGDNGMVFGLVGGFSTTRQDFRTTSNTVANTTFNVPAANLGGNFDPNINNDPNAYFGSNGPGAGYAGFQYSLPDNHTIETDQKQTLTGPSIGATLSLFRGGFFSDGLVKADFLDLSRTTTGSDTFSTTLTNTNFQNYLPIGGLSTSHINGQEQAGCINLAGGNGQVFNPPYTTSGRQTVALSSVTLQGQAFNFVVAENIGYHFDLSPGYWIEPVIGVRYGYSNYGNAAALGLEDGQSIRVQGGARFGMTSLVQDRYILTNSLTTLVYSDVWIKGFVIDPNSFSAGALLADEGKLRLQAALTSKIDLLNGFSAFVQAEGRYGDDYWGVGGKAGVRYQW